MFLEINGVWVEASDDDAYELVIQIAISEAGLEEVEEFFKNGKSGLRIK